MGGPCISGDWTDPSNEEVGYDSSRASLTLSPGMLPGGLPFCDGDGLGGGYRSGNSFVEQHAIAGGESFIRENHKEGVSSHESRIKNVSYTNMGPWMDGAPDQREGEEEERGRGALRERGVGGAPHPLRLPPLMPCGIFTAADSPLSQRVSPHGKGVFQQGSSTGFFSAVSTTADEAPPTGSMGVSSNSNAAAATAGGGGDGGGDGGGCGDGGEGSSDLKAHGARFAHTGSKNNAAHAYGFLCGVGGPPPLRQPLQQGGPSGANSSPSFGGASQQLQHACMHASSPTPPSPAAMAPLFHQVGGGAPKETDEGPLQFRPFTDQTTKYLEASLGEELLSVASHPCGFAATGFSSLHAGEGFPVEGGPPKGPLVQQTPGTNFPRPKDEPAAPACAAACAACKRNSRAVAPLPWVVVRPREEEEKALTPLAGKSAGCFFHASPTRYRCPTQQNR
ncbi:hypothetical protein ACSSS7_002720 [Eimeria intestinalis]